MTDFPKCILFNGLGGAGQRHLRIFRGLLPDCSIVGSRRKDLTPVLNSNFTVKQGCSLESEYNINFFPSIDEAYNQKPDLTVIATPTAFHTRDIIKAAENGSDIIVEKPGATNLQDANNIISAIKANNVRFLISYQRRFHPLTLRLYKMLKNEILGQIMSIRVVTSSYVPDWHPYENFKNLYAVRKDLGGGVLTTEIHEIDLLHWFFGKPKKILAIGGNRGSFDINVEDSVDLMFDYNKFGVQISLSFMQKKQERLFHIIGQDGWIDLDLINQKLYLHTFADANNTVYEDCITNEEMFKLQSKYFLENFELNNENYLEALINNSIYIEESQKIINN